MNAIIPAIQKISAILLVIGLGMNLDVRRLLATLWLLAEETARFADNAVTRKKLSRDKFVINIFDAADLFEKQAQDANCGSAN